MIASLPRRHVWPYLLGLAVLAVFVHWGRRQGLSDALGLPADVPVATLLAMVGLIHGDKLEALKALLPLYAGKVDLGYQ